MTTSQISGDRADRGRQASFLCNIPKTQLRKIAWQVPYVRQFSVKSLWLNHKWLACWKVCEAWGDWNHVPCPPYHTLQISLKMPRYLFGDRVRCWPMFRPGPDHAGIKTFTGWLESFMKVVWCGGGGWPVTTLRQYPLPLMLWWLAHYEGLQPCVIKWGSNEVL